MNDYVVTISGIKKVIKVGPNSFVSVDGKNVSAKLSVVNEHSYLLYMGDKVYSITKNKLNSEKYGLMIDGNYYDMVVRTQLRERAIEYLSKKGNTSHHDIVKAPMPGLILEIKKNVGDKVEIGDSVAILEAMKMENDIRSPSTGFIKEVHVEKGASVEKDEILLSIE